MKRLFLVTSSIELDPSRNFKGTQVRTVFDTQQRLDQTIQTIHNLTLVDPEADILILDSSAQSFADAIANSAASSRLTYVQLERLNPEVANRVRTHTNKSHCECTMLVEFFKHWKENLRRYDFITKICGRYHFEKELYDPSIFQAHDTDKFFFKAPMDWDESTFNHMRNMIPPEMIVNNRLKGHYTVSHAFGSGKIDQYESLMALNAYYTDDGKKMYYLDVEYCLHYFMESLGLNKDVVIVPWIIHGQCGVTGKRYTY